MQVSTRPAGGTGRALGTPPGADDPLAIDDWDQIYPSVNDVINCQIDKYHLGEADRLDCVQDVWQEIIARMAHFRGVPGQGPFWAWVRTMARCKAVDVIRGRRRHPTRSLSAGDLALLSAPAPSPAAACERSETQDLVWAALADLSRQVPARTYQVLHLRWIEGRTTAESAAALGLTPGQARTCLHRAKQRLGRLLRQRMQSDHPRTGPAL